MSFGDIDEAAGHHRLPEPQRAVFGHGHHLMALSASISF
jgi:hypothetical protein